MTSRTQRLSELATILAGFSAAAMALVVVVDHARSPQGSGQGEPIEVSNWEAFAEGGERRGSEEAPITVVEFGDYQCQFCRAVEPHLGAILRRYPSEVAIVYRHFPLASHPQAFPAAIAASCASQQGHFARVHERLMSSEDWMRGTSNDVFITLAREVGIPDHVGFEACIEHQETKATVEHDMTQGRELGVRGTPTFLVNDELYRGSLDSVRLRSMIDRLLEAQGDERRPE